MNWTDKVAEYCQDDTRRSVLNEVPFLVLASTDYVPDYVFWLEFMKVEAN